MKNYFIMTKCMFPLSKPKKIFHDIYFDNPRNITEIKKVAEVLKKANYIYPTFPENYNQVNKDYVSLEYIRDCFYDTYKEIDDVKCRKEENHYKNIYYHLARNWIIVRIGNYSSIDDNISVDNISVPSGKIIRVFSNEHFAEYEKQ